MSTLNESSEIFIRNGFRSFLAFNLEGPIIEQDIARVTHSHSIEDFIMKGRDLERMVLARDIKLHAERKTMVYNNKTVVFLTN